MSHRAILVTGFEPYGGRSANPSALVAQGLDGTEIEGARVTGRLLPVTFRHLPDRITGLLAETEPAIVVSLGLWPGEPMIRLERVAFNSIDCEIPDNEGTVLTDAQVMPDAPAGLPSRLPLRSLLNALLAAGIPARLSSSAGTFLCNATMYTFLRATESHRPVVPCGFVHLPYLPEQVADIVREARDHRTLELHQRADLSSMSLEMMMEAVRIILRTTLAHMSR